MKDTKRRTKTQRQPLASPDHDVAPTLQLAMKPTHEDVARRAFEIYLATGCCEGQCQENWKHAEEQLHQPTEPMHVS